MAAVGAGAYEADQIRVPLRGQNQARVRIAFFIHHDEPVRRVVQNLGLRGDGRRPRSAEQKILEPVADLANGGFYQFRIALRFSLHPLQPIGLEDPGEVIADHFFEIDGVEPAADIDLVIELNDPAQQWLGVEALQQFVVLDNEGCQAHILIGVPDVDRNRAPVLQPFLHEPPLADGDIGLHGGAHRHFANNTGVMIEVHVVSEVAGRVVHHLQTDRILRSFADKLLPVLEALRNDTQIDVAEVAEHSASPFRAFGVGSGYGEAGWWWKCRAQFQNAEWRTGRTGASEGVRWRLSSSSASTRCAVPMKETRLAAICRRSESLMEA